MSAPETSDKAPATSSPLLRAVGLSKSFGPVRVLNEIDIEVHAREVHTIIGENGAGKSTLMKLLAGNEQPTEGTIHIDGKPVTLTNPTVAEALGIVLVHQEILLAPDLTVAQNIYLGRELTGRWVVDDKAMRAGAKQILHELGADIDPDTTVSRLSIAQRQLVQIARVLLVPHRWMLMAAVFLALFLGAACGLVNGMIVTAGRIEPFIATLGAMGIYRGLSTWLSQGGSISMQNSELRALYRPVYFGSVFGVPIPVIVILAMAGVAAFILYRTRYGRHVLAVGSNEDVARYSGISVKRVRTIAYVIQGLCVAVAVLLYVPRLGSTSATTGIFWELQAITAVIIGGTALRGGVGRVWGTICGAFILELIGNIMLLSHFISEYLLSAVQGAIIIIAMLVQRSLSRR